MKLTLIFTVVLVVVAHAVHGKDYKGRSGMPFPGENDQKGMVLFDSQVPKPTSVTDPYNQVKFYLYTRLNKDKPTQIHVNDTNLDEVTTGKNYKFIIHGYRSSSDGALLKQIKDGFLNAEDCNVIAVDWSGPASCISCKNAFNDYKEVGKYVGEMHKSLKSEKKTHCVGHSLGAHACGISGKSVALERITGLDPALPGTILETPNDYLTKTDAHYVDVIHTCIGTAGVYGPTGHADFYPNCGRHPQPGCTWKGFSCSHTYAVKLFHESFTKEFVARECHGCRNYRNGYCNKTKTGIMGYRSKPNTKGIFYLTTNASPCIHTNLKIMIFITFVNLISK